MSRVAYAYTYTAVMYNFVGFQVATDAWMPTASAQQPVLAAERPPRAERGVQRTAERYASGAGVGAIPAMLRCAAKSR